MKSVRLLFLAAAALLISQGVVAQYEWLDHNGRHVFSDQLPPSDIPENRILKQPYVAPATTQEAEPDAAEEVEVPVSQAASTGDEAPSQLTDLERKKQEADKAEQTRLEAEEKQQQAARADNCQRARQSKRTLESGMRMAHLNEAGERVIIDDAQRAAELERAEKIIASDC